MKEVPAIGHNKNHFENTFFRDDTTSDVERAHQERRHRNYQADFALHSRGQQLFTGLINYKLYFEIVWKEIEVTNWINSSILDVNRSRAKS